MNAFNGHKVANQVRKASEFADVLIEAGCDPEGVFELNDVGWAMATQIVSARRGTPVDLPSDAVKTLVWREITSRSDTRPPGAHLLAGLPQ